jgi:uncharacterized membrane protein
MEKRSRVSAWVASIIESAGLGVIAYGVAQIYTPLGWILLGVLLALWGWALTPKGQDAMAERGPEYR